MKCKIVSFQEVHEMVRHVAENVKASEYNPTTVIGLARGGWIPARIICDFLGITDLLSLKVEHWLQTGKTKDEATIRYPLNVDLSEKKLLIVDDITDTGKSLITATEYLTRLNPAEMRTVTMQYLPKSKFRPNYFSEEVKEWVWFIYPWNWIEDTSTLIVRLFSKENGKMLNLLAINNGLKEYFEIIWDRTMLIQILQIMVERDQLESVNTKQDLSYKLKKSQVIQL
jgi:hypoxanthine phosphoribosyltransferase